MEYALLGCQGDHGGDGGRAGYQRGGQGYDRMFDDLAAFVSFIKYPFGQGPIAQCKQHQPTQYLERIYLDVEYFGKHDIPQDYEAEEDEKCHYGGVGGHYAQFSAMPGSFGRGEIKHLAERVDQNKQVEG